MSGYLTSFIVYTSAMVGIIFLALYVYKKTSLTAGQTSKSNFIGVEDMISLAPRKSIYVVRAGNERFLVASDVETTSLIAKLDDDSVNSIKHCEIKTAGEDLPVVIDFPAPKKKSNAIFQGLVERING